MFMDICVIKPGWNSHSNRIFEKFFEKIREFNIPFWERKEIFYDNIFIIGVKREKRLFFSILLINANAVR